MLYVSFTIIVCQVGAKTEMIHTSKWEPEKFMTDKFGAGDFKCHLQSGRIIWREDPRTPGTFEYQDQGDVATRRTATKDKTITRTEEHAEAPSDEECEKEFQALWDSVGVGSLADIKGAMWSNQPVLALQDKGKGKGKGKAVPPLLAIKDDPEFPPPAPPAPKTEEELVEEALQKCRKMRTLLQNQVSTLEEHLQNLKGNKFWTKEAAKEAQEHKNSMQANIDILQKLVQAKTKKPLESFQSALLVAAAVVKTNLKSNKDYAQLIIKGAGDNQSLAPSRASKRQKK